MKEGILLIEPFYGGSHKQLMDLLQSETASHVIVTLPAKKWHWRARTSALYFSQNIAYDHHFRILFSSSVLNLAELIALRPDLAILKKILYFHENQLEYPVRKQQDRDFQYGYNQILSCLVADVIVFNSQYNMSSFLCKINSHLKLIPDHRPKGLLDQIKPKCTVLYFPLKLDGIMCQNSGDFQKRQTQFGTNAVTKCAKYDNVVEKVDETFSPEIDGKNLGTDSQPLEQNIRKEGMTLSFGATGIQNTTTDIPNMEAASDCLSIIPNQIPNSKFDYTSTKNAGSTDGRNSLMDECWIDGVKPVHIVWPHRWEHDKDPDTFFQTLYKLHDEGFAFNVSVLGETYTDVPDIFSEAKEKLASHIAQWGYVANKQDYYRILSQGDVGVSTAKHEFFGVAMIEAVHLGCYPLCPNRLVYPEIFPKECLYNTENQLCKRLRDFCKSPRVVRTKKLDCNLKRFAWHTLRDQYIKLLLTQ